MSNANTVGFQFVRSLGEDLSQGTIELPSFPDTAFRIRSALEDPDVTARSIAKVVSADPVFTARLINVANSAAMSNRAGKPVQDLPTAVTRIGFKMAHTVAMSVAMNQVLKSAPGGKLYNWFNELWRHSLNVAAFSYVIAKGYSKINPDEAMIAGLMHDIGKIYIMSRAEKNFPELCDDLVTLGEVLQEWHTGVGHAILVNWGFDEAMAQAADEHETLDRTTDKTDLADVVLVANVFAHALEQGHLTSEDFDQQWHQIPAFARLGLKEEAIAGIAANSLEEIQAIIATLGS